MIKKQQKWIALFVALTFMWLLQVSTMPVTAADSREQVSSASSEPGPDSYEVAGYKARDGREKKHPAHRPHRRGRHCRGCRPVPGRVKDQIQYCRNVDDHYGMVRRRRRLRS